MAISAEKIGITPERLQESAQKFREELLLLPSIAVEKTTQYMSIRPGVTGKETVGTLEDGDAQFGPYDPHRKTTGEKITGRTLESFFGSVIHEFDPNSVAGSVYQSAITSGEGLKSADINKYVIANRLKVIGKRLAPAIWNGVRKESGTTTKDLFNGFDTIAQTEITAGNLSAAKKNFIQLTEPITRLNAVDQLKKIAKAATAELKEEDELYMFLDPDIKDLYDECYKAETGAVPYNKEYEHGVLEGFGGRIKFAPVASKAGSQFIQLTTKSNMLIGVDQISQKETLAVEKFSSFVLTLSAAMWWGVEYESIAPERLMVAKLHQQV